MRLLPEKSSLNMALNEQDKKGGRYTKKEQEERKLQVYHLHFEQGKAAVKIAELLNVNRNTINDDIRFWHQRIGTEINTQEVTEKMAMQIQRMEIQRDRLLEALEDAESLDQKIKLERFISDIDNNLTSVYSKMIVNGKEFLKTLKPKVDEKTIREFVRNLILSEDPNSIVTYSEDELRFRFIQEKKCSNEYAENTIEKMMQLGLDLCKAPNMFGLGGNMFPSDSSTKYNLLKFTNLRSYPVLGELIEITKTC